MKYQIAFKIGRLVQHHFNITEIAPKLIGFGMLSGKYLLGTALTDGINSKH